MKEISEASMDNKLMILVMEDDPEIASLYSQVLNNRRHEVTITRLGEDCLQIYTDRLQELYAKKNRPSRRPAV
jgi:CheY-like chemotaxis protein